MCVSVCVSEALLKEMKDILMTWTAVRGGGFWRTVNLDGFFVCLICCCMYEEYLHSLTSSLAGGQTLVKQVPPPYPPPLSSTPCLPVNLTARAFPNLSS